MNQVNVLVNIKYRFNFKKDFQAILNAFNEILQFSTKTIYVDVLITDSKQMQQISQATRQIDHPTDVLAFPFNLQNSAMDYVFLGEIILCYDKIKQQAKTFNHSIRREFCFLFAHALVHLAGFDHKTSNKMEQKFNKIVYNIMENVNIRRF